MRIPSFAPLAFLVLTLALAACAGPQITVPRMAPAEINLAGYKRLAIGGVGGPDGSVVTAEVTSAVFATNRFEVLDRANLAQVTKEQDFQISGRVSDDKAVSIGQMIGAAALLVGDVLAETYDEDVNRQDSECSRDGKKARCVDFTRSAAAHLTVTLKVIDTESGKILAVKSLDAQEQRSTTQSQTPPSPFNARDEMLEVCRKKIATDFADVIAPHTVNITVQLLDDGDLPELERGNNYAKLGDWTKALGEYSAAVDRIDQGKIDTDDQAKAYYDLGIGYGYSGQYEQGVAALEKSFSLDPQDRTQQEIAKIKKFQLDDVELAKQNAAAQASN
jgi:tetratricopeptide (TPR) repeat protein